MSKLDEKLEILKKKKFTAKRIVEEQRAEIRTLKSSLTFDERFQRVRQNFQNLDGIDEKLLKKILFKTNEDKIQQMIDKLSNLLEQIQTILSLKSTNELKTSTSIEISLKQQNILLEQIQWKLSDLYAHRLAEEVSCITS